MGEESYKGKESTYNVYPSAEDSSRIDRGNVPAELLQPPDS